jgi:uncharacterized protein YkwD
MTRTRALAATAVIAAVAMLAGCGVASASTDARRSAGAAQTNAPVVGIASTPSGQGFWRVTAAGEVLTAGDASWYGGTANLALSHPIAGIASTPDGRGYWLVAADGGVFTFGDAAFYGSAANIPLRSPVIGIAATPDGRGYRLAAADGGVFTFGDATFYGSLGDMHLEDPIAGVAGTSRGYVLVAADGGVFTFGHAKFSGSAAASCPDAAAVGVAASARVHGYWVTFANGRTYAFSRRSSAPRCAVARRARVARDIFDRLNRERVARGLPPLRWDAGLARYASDWSRGMASFGFRHSAISNLLTDGRFAWVGENIAWVGAPATAGRLHTMWMTSPHHRDNIASPTYTAVGIGVFCAPDGTTWATENFARDASFGPGAPAAPAPPAPFVEQGTDGQSC